MRFGINTLDDFDLFGKTVLCRADMNQPVDRVQNKLKSTARISACVPTIRELSEKGAKIVLLVHQGSDIEYKNFFHTQFHAQVLTSLLGKTVRWSEDVCGPEARKEIQRLENGDILLLNNVRFCSEEQTLFELKLRLSHEEQAKTQLVSKLAPLADLFVCDAFAAAHRDQPSICGFEQLLPSAMGRLFEKEYCVISELMEDKDVPCLFVLGGAKIADAFLMMETVLSGGIADCILTGGLAGNIMLAAKGIDIGQGSMDVIRSANYEEYIEKGRELIEKYGDKIRVPVDVAYVEEGVRLESAVDAIPNTAVALDIGQETAAEYSRIIGSAPGKVFVNGPMGVFEQESTEYGTKVVWDALGKTSAYTIVGGGDSITATTKYEQTDNIDYICTGGGALIRFLTGEELPAVKALRFGSEKFGCDKK